MSNTFHNSERALAHALLDELAKAESNRQHAAILISYNAKSLPNGINHCTVQIECRAGCGWLVEACEEEAEALMQRAIAIKRMLQCSTKETLEPLPRIFSAVFPELVLGKTSVPKNTKELKSGGP